MSMHVIRISKDGTARFIHSDTLRKLMVPGVTSIRRASHVEPGDPGKGQDPLSWYADMKPCNGPALGPFETRDVALKEEVRWLHQQKIPVPSVSPP